MELLKVNQLKTMFVNNVLQLNYTQKLIFHQNHNKPQKKK